MSKIAVAICGSSGIDYTYPELNLEVFRSLIILDDKQYVDYIDIKPDEFYKKLEEAKSVKTAQVSTGELLEMFERLRDKGYTDVIAITLSSGLSGTYQGVCFASEIVEEIKVHPFDSLFLGYPEAKMGYVAHKMASEGYTVEEILEKLTRLRDSQRTLIAVDTLRYLVLNGRLSAASGLIGGLLKIKPLLEASKEGKIVVKERIRTKKKTIARMTDIFLEEIKNKENIEPYILYTNNYEEMLELREKIENLTNFKNIILLPLPSVIGLHAGPGTCGIGYIEKE
ncbi:MAG TPA: DegV family protein [Acholeplasmataceae bacterium]|nr:DegV family protein [Acholeplasmataceae bacterium]